MSTLGPSHGPSALSQIAQAAQAGMEFGFIGPPGAPHAGMGGLGPGADMRPGAGKVKPSLYTFPIHPPPDSDALMTELEDFYSYVEISHIIEYRKTFEKSSPIGNWKGIEDFSSLPDNQKHSLLLTLTESLEHRDPEVRFESSRRLLYVAQGSFASAATPKEHLAQIVSNAKALRKAGALEAVWNAMKVVGGRWELLNTDFDPSNPAPSTAGGLSISPQDRQEYIEELNSELAILLGVAYFMVEVFRGEEAWGDEIMSLDPPMPVYLLQLVANLREKNARGYPVKKLLLLLWKSILCTIGGLKDAPRVKKLVRDIEGLPKDKPEFADPEKVQVDRPWTKVSPVDVHNFHTETTTKYPTYTPPPVPNVYIDRLAAAAAPIPVRPLFPYSSGHQQHYSGITPPPPPSTIAGQNMQPGTPAPTPPPTPPPMGQPNPKTKKQMFQTDQNKPFVLPFSMANFKEDGTPRTVPEAIEEANALYRKNLRISTELWQVWKLREEFIADESGMSRLEEEEKRVASKRRKRWATATLDGLNGLVGGLDSKKVKELRKGFTRMSIASSGSWDDYGGDEEEEEEEANKGADPLKMLQNLEGQWKLEERSLALQESRSGLTEEQKKERRRLKARIEDLRRLQKIEVLFRSTLPHLQSAVIVLLKLLLATVTQPNAQNPQNPDDEPMPLTLEETDVMRHREITSKAVSAILVLLLKWFKVSHIMKFHYLAQLLVDSNCILLILKMFGLQEVANIVKFKHEVEEFHFFRYCNTYGSRNPIRSEEAIDPRPPSHDGEQGEEVDLITDYSWRNFFSTINFVYILQKLTKRRSHRIMLLVQYKSSAILKRILKVSHPKLQLYVLKVIKNQVPYYGRKWRQSNMKVITAIYLNCRPDLRDEWLMGVDVDSDLDDALPQEHALRALVKFFTTKHYSIYAPQQHRRSSSLGQPGGFHGEGHPASPASAFRQSFAGGHNTSSLPDTFEGDMFPPPRSAASWDDHFRATYIPDAIMEGYLDNYEEIIDGLFDPRPITGEENASLSAWNRLGQILGEGDDISDSESVASIGFLGTYDDDGSSTDGGWDSKEEQVHRWEAISPETMNALEEEKQSGAPRSPRPRRKSSGPTSPALRPVLSEDGEDYSNPVIMDREDEQIMEALPHEGPAVDEVEAVFHV